MSTSTEAPYGNWRSPISTRLITARSIALSHPLVAGKQADSRLWSESRPAEQGRTVIVEQQPDGQPRDRIPAGFNVRSRAHEYGGGAWTAAGPTLWFINDLDRRIYEQSSDAAPQAVTAKATCNYADLQASPDGNSLIAIQEMDARDDNEPISRLVRITLGDADRRGTIRTLAQGDDFYASARCSGDGRQLAWLSWSHPNMPWDSTRLWLADVLADGSLANPRPIAGGPEESIFQPQWSADGTLWFVSDRSGWWNLYRWDGQHSHAALPMQAEFGLPQWVFGMSTYGICSDGRLLCAFSRGGRWQLGLLNPDAKAGQPRWRELQLPYTEFSDLSVYGQTACMLAAAPQQAPAIIALDINKLSNAPSHSDSEAITLLRHSVPQLPDPAWLSKPRFIDYPSANDETAHALYYPPCNPDYHAPAGEKPPLLVRSHGGPTAAASSALNLSIQYWTSRGFAVLDVNYGGSTGYGRRYRERLNGRWGETDVDDCVYGARTLINQGLADPQRCAIRGSSAGGYTTLAALTFRDLFRAGASLYGIGDLEALVHDTHKFESRYLDRLIGPWPQQQQRYRQRSPIHHTEQLSCPIIFMQGQQDKVVPPSQAEAMVDALRSKGLPVAYLSFANEQHGFRAADTISTALQAELYFYARIFGFQPADTLPAIDIENL